MIFVVSDGLRFGICDKSDCEDVFRFVLMFVIVFFIVVVNALASFFFLTLC